MSCEVIEHRPFSWVSDLADALIREIFQETAGILLERTADLPPDSGGAFVSIYSKSDGAYTTELIFRGELPLFFQIASNMMEVPSPCMEDAVDYGLELFNIFCGRFISEIHRATGVPARFYPPQYLGTQPRDMTRPIDTICYRSQGGLHAQFLWTSDSVEQLHTRRSAV